MPCARLSQGSYDLEYLRNQALLFVSRDPHTPTSIHTAGPASPHLVFLQLAEVSARQKMLGGPPRDPASSSARVHRGCALGLGL